MRVQGYIVEIAEEINLSAAVVLNQLRFWSQRGKRDDGWVYKTHEELGDELGISKKQVMGAYTSLEEAGYIETKVMQVSGRPTKHFRLLQKVTLESDKRELSMESDKRELSYIEHKQPETTNKSEIKISDEAKSISLLLLRLIQERNPRAAKETATKQWAVDIDKIHRIDGFEWKEVEKVLRWCQADSFWQNNILSGAKLRKQFGQLMLRMDAENEEEEDIVIRTMKRDGLL